MRKIAVTVLMGSLLPLAGAALAADHIKPGLWEMTIKSDAMKNMPQLTPEQLDRMKRAGVSMPQMNAGNVVTKFCVTKEMSERDEPPVHHNGSGCTTKNSRRGGGTFSVDMVCDGPDMKGTGTVKGTYSSDGSFSSVTDFNGVAHGHPISNHTEGSGKWISADCGDVKPMGKPSK